MDSDMDQILLLVAGFFTALMVLLVVMDRLESSIHTQHVPVRRRLAQAWDIIRRRGPRP
jgi:hypothetical protein